jgi:hypothetical protein
MRWFAFFFALPLLSQPAQLSYVGATGTQIVFSYQAPDDNPCSVAAVNSDDPSVPVYDVDFNTFPGSPAVDSDFRHEWNRGTRARFFVLGKRTSDTGTDGKLYSRALEVDALHTITVTCTGGSQVLRARTSRLVRGDTFPENPPFNPSGVGSWAWPTIDWSNRSRPLIDPMTGVKLKLATAPGDYANKKGALFGTNFWVDWTGHWNNPQNAVSGTTETLATYAGAGNEALFLGVDPSVVVANRMYGGWGGGEAPFSVDDFGVHVIGSGTDAAAANRTVSVCLSIDSGQSCYTNSFPIVLPSGTAADTGVRPPNFPAPVFAGWGKTVLRAHLPTSGTGDVSGNILTLTGVQNGSTFFNPDMKPGSKIRIPGSSAVCSQELCTVQAVQDATHLRLVESLNLTGVTFTTANFGVRIVKTTGTGSIAVSLRYENAWSFPYAMPYTGATEMCSHVPVQVSVNTAGLPLPNGQKLTGYNCSINGSWYWISTDTGEARLISITIPPPASAFSQWDPRDVPNIGQAPPGVGAFDLQDGNVAYTYAQLGQGGKSLFRLEYQGDYRAFSYNYPTGNWGEQPNAVLDSVRWTNISPISQGKDIATQIRNRFPAYDASRYGEVTEFYGISGDYAMFLHTIGGQDTPCWVFLYNVRTGVLEHGFNSWDGSYDPLFRWAGCHSGGPGSAPNTAMLSVKPIYVNSNSSAYGGPFATQVTSVLRANGMFDTNTAVASDPDGSYEPACPAGLPSQYAALSGTNQCLTIRVAGEACSSVATANEKTWSPCPWDSTKSMLQPMAVGDWMMNPDAGYNSEHYTILKKTVLSPASIELVLQRHPGPNCGNLAIQRRHNNGWRIMMAASGLWTCENAIAFIDPVNRVTYQEHYNLIAGHFDFGVGSRPDTYSLLGQGTYKGRYGYYAIRDSKPLSSVGQDADYYVNLEPRFSGVNSASWTMLQTYGSKRQWNASVLDKRWALDFRHYNGLYGIAFESSVTGLAANQTALVAGTSNVYRVSVIGEAKVKKVPLLAYAGYHLLTEKSSPAIGDTLTDADIYRFCYAYRDGECRHDSSAGQAFVSVPAVTNTGYCQAANYARNIPCVMSSHPWGGWATQFDTTKQDVTASGIRRLTMGLTGPGRQYAYGNLRALPDGKWALMSGWWLDGVRLDVLLVKLPAFQEADSANRNDFAAVTVPIGALTGATQAVVDFGYAEYGEPSNFYCTPRAERCVAVSGTIDANNPYLFASEMTQGMPCASGCTIRVPALPSHVLYYRVRYLDAAGTVVSTLPMRIIASPETGN